MEINMMLRKILVLAAALLLGKAAYAVEAGKIIFVAGNAKVAAQAAVLNAPVGEGELLSTGADGYIYIKTVDNGFFILRPNTQARIASYHIDADNPANTRIKLELLSGVARSQSGQAVKLARQNFRFNTPVAAIGVRGTDFTVSTDGDVSRVTVISGAITMSSFVGGCRPEGSGPCEGSTARELTAAQKGQLLQVQRGQSAPQLLQGNNSLAPDVVAPPRTDEPGKATTTTTSVVEPSLDAHKSALLQSQVQTLVQTPPTTVAPPTTVPPEVVVTTPVDTSTDPVTTTPTDTTTTTPVTTPALPLKAVTWGRWTAIANKPATSGVSKDGATRIALNDYYVLFRDNTGSSYVIPEKGSVAFAMTSGEAYVKDTTLGTKSLAAVENGTLAFNFDTATFATQLDVVAAGDRFTLANSGKVKSDGIFSATNTYTSTSNMSLTGVLASDTEATYLFQAILDSHRAVSGVTVWAAKK
jgi:hypothetical protein